MRHRTFIAKLCAVAALTLLSGCAGLGPVSPPPGSGALQPDSELVGTWTGSLNWVAPSLYDDEANLRLQIREDGTFTATVTPGRAGNNLAKPSRLAGTVVANGKLVTLRNEVGPWPWLTLKRSGDTLYGIANDPGDSIGRDAEVPSGQHRPGDGVWIYPLELTRAPLVDVIGGRAARRGATLSTMSCMLGSA